MVKNLRASLDALEQSELPEPTTQPSEYLLPRTIPMNPATKTKPFGLAPSAPTYLTLLQDISLLQEDLDSSDPSDPKVVTLISEISTTKNSVLSTQDPTKLNIGELLGKVI
jgi:hypothetical protein